MEYKRQRGAGAKVGASSSLADAVKQAPWRIIVLSRDNLVVNDCPLCLEQEVAAIARQLDDDPNTDCPLYTSSSARDS